MRRCALSLATLLLIALAAVRVEAQWEVAFQDQSRKELNAIYFADRDTAWVIGEDGIIHATRTNGESWFRQDPRVKLSLSDVYFRDHNEGWLIASGALVSEQRFSEQLGPSIAWIVFVTLASVNVAWLLKCVSAARDDIRPHFRG